MIVTLLTDFGLADHYVAAMKGVILSHDPGIRIVDISHDVPAFDLRRAAFLLAACHTSFPAGTVHVVVVDPGVGSARRPLAIRARGSFFVGPDNGVLGLAVGDAPDLNAVQVDPSAVREGAPSATFHGRDVFAPAAAALATGTPLEGLGPPIDDWTELEGPTRQWHTDGVLEGSILHVDRFGNCVTSLRPSDFPGGDWRPYVFHARGHQVDRKATHYAEGGDGAAFVLLGSTGFLELGVNRGSAAERLGLRTGDPVRAEPGRGSRLTR